MSMEGLGSGVSVPERVAVELHEDQVPDLEPAVAVAGGPEARPPGLLLRARQVVALVEVDLRAGPAGTGVAHGPEVVLLAQAQDAVVARPATVFHSAKASSSSVKTVALSRSLGSPSSPVRSSQQNVIASSLK